MSQLHTDLARELHRVRLVEEHAWLLESHCRRGATAALDPGDVTEGQRGDPHARLRLGGLRRFFAGLREVANRD